MSLYIKSSRLHLAPIHITNFFANNAPLYQKLFTPTARTSMRAYIRYKNHRLLCALVCPKIIFLSATCPYIRYIFKRRHYAPISKQFCPAAWAYLRYKICVRLYTSSMFSHLLLESICIIKLYSCMLLLYIKEISTCALHLCKLPNLSLQYVSIYHTLRFAPHVYIRYKSLCLW